MVAAEAAANIDRCRRSQLVATLEQFANHRLLHRKFQIFDVAAEKFRMRVKS